MVKASLLIIGDEILIGQIQETNSNFLGKELFKLGFDVQEIRVVKDEEEKLLNNIDELYKKSSIVLITGGLGPTNDDVTKKTLAHYFNANLVEDAQALEHISRLYSEILNRPLNKLTRTQALVPEGFTALKNNFGTAPGLWKENDDKVIAAMPGVPSEMRHLFTERIAPRLKYKFDATRWWRKDLITFGIPESELAIRLEDWEKRIPAKLAYLPNGPRIKLRLIAEQEISEKDWQSFLDEFKDLTQEFYVGEGETDFDLLVFNYLKENDLNIAVAESCTGGALAAAFTSQSGSSAYFKGGIVSYATEVKQDILDVSEESIKTESVVSESVAKQMAENVRKKLSANFGISTTGVAGPNLGEDGNPVGTLWIGFSSESKTFAKKLSLKRTDRKGFIKRAVRSCFEQFYLRLDELKN